MAAQVGESYDEVAELYASLFLGDLEEDDNARHWLERFAESAAGRAGTVADLGCGPGHVVDHLSRLGLRVIGYDLSAGQIEQARAAFPDHEFGVGDLTALTVPDGSLGGIVSRYSIIHLEPAHLSAAFEEWIRVLEPGAPVLVSFFGSLSPDDHGTPFEHQVTTAYELHPATVAQDLRQADFERLEIDTVAAPPDARRQFDQATILAHKPTDPSAG